MHKKLLIVVGVIVLLGVGIGTYSILERHTFDNSNEDALNASAYWNQPDNLGGIIGFSDIIVEGVVIKVHDSLWPTRDGVEPENIMQVREMRREGIDLRTPVELSVKRVLKGETVPDTIMFTALGGEYPGMSISYGTENELQMLKEGVDVVVLLSQAPANAGPWAEITPLYLQMVFKVDGEKLHGPQKTILQSDFIKQIEGSK